VSLAASLLLLSLVGCDATVQSGSAEHGDRGPLFDMGAEPDAGIILTEDDGVDADTGYDPLDCDTDDACPPAQECAGGACVAPPEVAALVWPRDGVVRMAAAGFDIAPEEIETWRDAAGPNCPDNRPGRFDGRVDQPPREGACLDTYDDANGNGRFDAVWLAGDGLDRPAADIDNDNPPAGRVVLITRDDEMRLLVVLDLHAVGAARASGLAKALTQRLGLPSESVIVQATGNRSAPDAVGLSGPGIDRLDGVLRRRLDGAPGLLGSLPMRPGVDLRWWDALVARCEAASRRAGARLVPVRIRTSIDPLPVGDIVDTVPDANRNEMNNDVEDLEDWRARPQALVTQHHLPRQVDPSLRTLRVDDTNGDAVAVLVSWAVAPATVHLPVISADFPGRLRAEIEARLPGAVAVWLPGAADDTTLAGAGAFIPSVDADGHPINADAMPVDFEDATPAQDPTRALGRYLAALALDGIDEGEAVVPQFEVTSRYAWLPLTNPRFGLAARLGLMPLLGDWLTGRAPTDAWASEAQAPACGGLGCLRFRLDCIDLGPVTLLTTPAALDASFSLGRDATSIDFADERNLRDLDGDAVPDAVDREIEVLTRSDLDETPVLVDGPANPQRFDAIEGLGGADVWVLGRANGGTGSLGSRESHQNVFEGQLDGLRRAIAAPPVADFDLCGAAFPCFGRIAVGELVALTWSAQPALLADLPGAHELALGAALPVEWPIAAWNDENWHLENADGDVVLFGGSLRLGPGRRVFIPEHDLVQAGIGPGDVLALGPPGAIEVRLPIEGVVPVVLREHPNAGDAWSATSPAAGDLVYTVACELLVRGPCPTARGELMQGLPMAPER
jgi:hypothetical protein